jgi:hypothetical protein
MKINESTVLVGKKVRLVPYKPLHVPKYHEWMTQPQLLGTHILEAIIF